MTNLPRRGLLEFLLEGEMQRIMVGKNDEFSALEHMLKVLYSFVCAQEFAVIRTVPLLSRTKPFRVKSNRLHILAKPSTLRPSYAPYAEGSPMDFAMGGKYLLRKEI